VDRVADGIRARGRMRRPYCRRLDAGGLRGADTRNGSSRSRSVPLIRMERILEGAPLPPLPNRAVVTIGKLDGVHRGHQALLAELRRQADELSCPAVVVTFDRHPASVVRPETAPRLLTALGHRLELLDAAGVDYAYVLRFDEERSLESPE